MRIIRIGHIVAFVLSLLGGTVALSRLAFAFEIGYGGRLVDAQGQPLAGPIDILVRFYSAPTGDAQLGPTQTYAATPLVDGTFQL